MGRAPIQAAPVCGVYAAYLSTKAGNLASNANQTDNVSALLWQFGHEKGSTMNCGRFGGPSPKILNLSSG